MQFRDGSFSFPLIPTLISLAVGILIGWLLLGWWLLPVHTTEGGPRNLKDTHLDTLVAGLVPAAEAGDGIKLGTALCYPADDYEAVDARRVYLDSIANTDEDVDGSAIFTVQNYNLVLGTFDQLGCAKFIKDNPGQSAGFFDNSPFSPLWCILGLMGLGVLLGLAWLLLNARGTSFANINPFSSREKSPRNNRRSQRSRIDSELNTENNNYEVASREEDRPSNSNSIRTFSEDVPPSRRTNTDSYRSQERSVDMDADNTVSIDEPYSPPPRPYSGDTSYSASTTGTPLPPPLPTEPEPELSLTEPTTSDVSDGSDGSDGSGFTASYIRGNNTFERVFEIYGTDNQYLGDCSVEIADIIGNAPTDVTAFKIRLFEAGTPRSITKLIMSEHAYNDNNLNAKLATQGDAVLAQMGEPITLEGDSITVDTYITDLVYSNDSGQPVRSVFDKFAVRLKAFVNEIPDDSY